MDVFYRNQLGSPQAMIFYDRLLSEIRRGNIGGLYCLTPERSETAVRDGLNAIQALRNDHPEFFHLNPASQAVLSRGKLSVINRALYTPSQIKRLSRLLEHLLQQLTAGTRQLSDWEKERVIYDRIVRYMHYENRHEMLDHNVAGPILRESGVCESYVCLMILTLRRVGIPCIRVNGYGRKEAHCWNMVWLGGHPCHLDVTWDKEINGQVSHFYFNLTDDEITKTHTIRTPGLPVCNTPSLNYYRRQDLLFDSSKDAARAIASAFRAGRSGVQIRLAEGLDLTQCIKQGVARSPCGTYAHCSNPEYQTAVITRTA